LGDNELLIFAGSQDSSVRVWNVTTQQEIALFNGHEKMVFGAVNSVAFDESGRYLASGWMRHAACSIMIFHGTFVLQHGLLFAS
jgi:WD40 repeat protein